MTTVIKTNRKAMRWFCTRGSYVLYVLVATVHLLLTGYSGSCLYQLRQQQCNNNNNNDESRNQISSKSQSAQDEKGDTGKKMGKNSKGKNSAQGQKTKRQKKKGATPK